MDRLKQPMDGGFHGRDVVRLSLRRAKTPINGALGTSERRTAALSALTVCQMAHTGVEELTDICAGRVKTSVTSVPYSQLWLHPREASLLERKEKQFFSFLSSRLALSLHFGTDMVRAC